MEEKVVEAIVYTLTSINGVNKVIIYVDGNILTKLPQTKINLPSTLDRSFGINKEYDINSIKDIKQVTIKPKTECNSLITVSPADARNIVNSFRAAHITMLHNRVLIIFRTAKTQDILRDNRPTVRAFAVLAGQSHRIAHMTWTGIICGKGKIDALVVVGHIAERLH